jgi:hypothetical protein
MTAIARDGGHAAAPGQAGDLTGNLLALSARRAWTKRGNLLPRFLSTRTFA